MAKIQLLDSSVSELIAAGEVVLIPAEMNEVAINGNATIVEYYIE